MVFDNHGEQAIHTQRKENIEVIINNNYINDHFYNSPIQKFEPVF